MKRKAPREERRRAVVEMNLLSDTEEGDRVGGLLGRRRSGCFGLFGGVFLAALAVHFLVATLS